jgi:hypothetical protein
LAIATATATGLALAGGQAFAGQSAARVVGPSVLLVCNGSTKPCPTPTTGQYTTIQAAVNAAKPGDWILVWPGVYHENSYASNPSWLAGVYVATKNLHIRGLNRNSVIIDGSKGTPSQPCPSSPALQNFGPPGDPTSGTGWDGLVVAASGVTVQNLTVCDYLHGTQGHGNEIWWNGGDGSGLLGMGSFSGSYLTATSEFTPTWVKGGNKNFAEYGIFVSNARGPGSITHSYASNMADSNYYVGACQRQCNTVLSHDVGTNSILGFSGTNAGGRLIIKDSLFYNNGEGIVPNSLNNDDAPPPQNGRCPHTHRSCMIIEHNVVRGNNNPNTPFDTQIAVIGTGIELSGASYDTVRNNVIKNQGAWGVLANDYPDNETPPPLSHCQGGFPNVNSVLGLIKCDFPARGNLIYRNTFTHVGFFGNATNSDLATIGLFAKSATPRNCFYSNHTLSHGRLVAPTSSPAHIELSAKDGPPCGRPGTFTNGTLLGQLLCDAYGLCEAGMHYPVQTKYTIVPLPKLKPMPAPCSGVPANKFCA